MPTPVVPLRAFAGLALVFAVSAGCTGAPRGGEPTPPSSGPTSWAPATEAEREHETPTGEVRAAIALDADKRIKLGLPPLGQVVDPAALPPLSAAQWADPGAVGARLAIVQTNYRAVEAWSSVRGRWLPYLVPRLAEDLTGSVAGEMASDLRERDAVFAGDVLGLAVDERSEDRAVVSLTIRRSVLSGGGAVQPPRVGFWVFTLVLDRASDHWLVAELERS